MKQYSSIEEEVEDLAYSFFTAIIIKYFEKDSQEKFGKRLDLLDCNETSKLVNEEMEEIMQYSDEEFVVKTSELAKLKHAVIYNITNDMISTGLKEDKCHTR